MTLMTGTSGPSADPSELADGLLEPVLEVVDPGVVAALEDAVAESLTALFVASPAVGASFGAPPDVTLAEPDAAESGCGWHAEILKAVAVSVRTPASARIPPGCTFRDPIMGTA